MTMVGASEFGGPNDPGTGHIGYKGDDLRGKMAYAELLMGTALGNLPHGTKARLTYNGKSVIAEKLDIGAGGSPVQGHVRALDIWYETANALGFSGLGVVDFQMVDLATPTTLTEVNIPNPINGIDSLKTIADKLTSTGFWVRLGLLIFGVIGLFFGVHMLIKGTTLYQETSKQVGKVSSKVTENEN